MKLSQLSLVLPLLLCCTFDVVAKSRAPEVFRCAWEAPRRAVFEISRGRQALEIPDFIYYRIKKDELVMEVVQGREKERFEPILTYVVYTNVKDTSKDRIKALAQAYDQAFARACQPLDRRDNTEARPVDGFAVTPSEEASSGLLRTTVTLYDYDDAYREQLVKSIQDLATLIEVRYETIAKYTADLSTATTAYVKIMSDVRQQLGGFDGRLDIIDGRLRDLRLVQAKLIDIDESLELMLLTFKKGTAEQIAELRRDFAATERDIASKLQAIRSDLAEIKRAD